MIANQLRMWWQIFHLSHSRTVRTLLSMSLEKKWGAAADVAQPVPIFHKDFIYTVRGVRNQPNSKFLTCGRGGKIST